MLREDNSADLPEDALREARSVPLPQPPLAVNETHVFGSVDPQSSSHAVISSAPKVELAPPTSQQNEGKFTLVSSPSSLTTEEGGPRLSVDATVTAGDSISTLEEGRNQTIPPPKETDVLFPSILNPPPQEMSETLEPEEYSRSRRHSMKKQDGGDLLTLSGTYTLSPMVGCASSRSQKISLGYFTPLGSTSTAWKAQGGSAIRRHQTVSLLPLARGLQSSSSFVRCESGFGATWLSLTVHGMSSLHADPSVVYPFVRVWFVNAETGETLIQNIDERALFALTHPVDIRQRQTQAPWWGAELTFRVDPSVFDNPSLNAMLLLEVLEAGSETIQGLPLRRDGLYPVCWGFLKLHDKYGRLNLKESIDIQMFPFPQRASCTAKFLQMLPSCFFPSGYQETLTSSTCAPVGPDSQANTSDPPEKINRKRCKPPELFHIFKDPRNRKVPYSAGMLLSLKKINDDMYLPKRATVLPYEEHLLNQMSVVDEMRPKSSMSLSLQLSNIHRTKNTSNSLVNIGALSNSYIRDGSERVVPPTTVLQQIQVKGSVTSVAFSKDGFTMAFGLSSGFEYVIQLRNTLAPEIPIVGIFRGHVGHIHHVAFINDGQMLLSCSSDKTAKIWRLESPFSFPGDSDDESTGCLCTLPHDFPVYDGIFFQEHIITCGYDTRLFVWRYYHDSDGTSVDSSSHRDFLGDSGNLGENFLGSSLKTAIPKLSFDTESSVCELVHVASDNDRAIFRSLCASELNRIWSVDALGNVVVWRAMYAKIKDGKPTWQMSLRHRFNCPGATRIEICGNSALVICGKLPICYLFDTSTCRLIHEINLHQRPYVTALTLLPDGEAVVAGTGDGKLLSWECNTGSLCTPKTGYEKTQVSFSVDNLTWSKAQQLCVLLGTKMNAEKSISDAHPRFTMVALIGTPRTDESVILRSDNRAADYFRARFGGELTARRSGRTGLGDSRASFRLYADKTLRPRKAELPPRETLSGDRTSRMDQIVSMWKTLVGQHRHVNPDKSDVAPHDPTAIYIADDE
ncbi:putative jouberin-like [Trypanosoma theileri]|uniref:Putative jouberin-like n=1 Tax=Trypanosoma theileri TaxID=67003 RepID=A0A1X0NV73_9TRYP|nr:putative jouberin-like [Trypanosoma theileri]ORC88393.1 putative jouberin-like [Trypanosoma theileri]